MQQKKKILEKKKLNLIECDYKSSAKSTKNLSTSSFIYIYIYIYIYISSKSQGKELEED